MTGIGKSTKGSSDADKPTSWLNLLIGIQPVILIASLLIIIFLAAFTIIYCTSEDSETKRKIVETLIIGFTTLIGFLAGSATSKRK